MLRKYLVTACAVMSFAMFGGAVNVYAADVTLYEVTENMKLKNVKKGVRRQATSALTGKAAAGTPLCPLPVDCAINATGSDDISVSTGQGDFTGKWSTVVPGDNNVDAPEYEVLSGSFHGLMDFSPALVNGIPYGTVVGELWIAKTKTRYPFTGIFYLPFTCPDDPLQRCYLDWSNPTGMSKISVEREFSIGFPTVKFELTFPK
jgi:hypothetical protein